MKKARRLHHASMVVDGEGVCCAPGALLIEDGSVAAAGSPESIGRVEGAQVFEHPDRLLMPALVNAHTHLDLSHLPPQLYEGNFARWIEFIIRNRCVGEAEIARATQRGIDLSLAGGTAIVGDIAGVASRVPIRELRASPLRGVSYFEVFGLGARQGSAIEQMRDAVDSLASDAAGVRLGLQPHAPYSCGPEVYRAACSTGLPVSTHLAESLEEESFLTGCNGPFVDILHGLGIDESDFPDPRAHAADLIEELECPQGVLIAHLNYIEPRHVRMLAARDIHVAYCPRASAYFGHPQDGRPQHMFRALHEAGVNVALGTDGLLCLDTLDRISVLDEMRFLFARDGADPRFLLRMATVNGARALGFEASLVTFAPGPIAGILHIPIDPNNTRDPLEQALMSDVSPSWLEGPIPK